MSKHGHCHECGGSDGLHYPGCIYDGTEGGYSSHYRRKSGVSTGKWWIAYIVALIIGYGINELLGVIIMIGLILILLV